jgi:hypothetical protein
MRRDMVACCWRAGIDESRRRLRSAAAWRRRFEKGDSRDVHSFNRLLTVTLVPLLSPSGSWLSPDL